MNLFWGCRDEENGRDRGANGNQEAVVVVGSPRPNQNLSPDNNGRKKHQSNLIDIMLESYMTSTVDEHFIVRARPSKKFVKPDGELEDFLSYNRMENFEGKLNFRIFDDHENIRGCVSFGDQQQQEEGSLYNFFCLDLQVLVSPVVSSSVLPPNTTPGEYIAAGCNISPKSPPREPRFNVVIDTVASHRPDGEDVSITRFLNSLISLKVDGGENPFSELLAAKILLQIIKFYSTASSMKNKHIVGINHGMFTIGKVVASSGDLFSWIQSSPAMGPHIFGKSMYLQSVPKIVVIDEDRSRHEQERSHLNVGRTITATLLRNFERTFSTRMVLNSLYNVGYTRMAPNGEARTYPMELVLFMMQTTNRLTYTAYKLKDESSRHSSLNFRDSLRVGKIEGCFNNGDVIRVCMQLVVLSSTVLATSSIEFTFYFGLYLREAMARGIYGSPHDIDVNDLEECGSENVPECIGAILTQVNGMLDPGAAIHSVAIHLIKYGPSSPESSSSSATTTYIYNQFYYVGNMIDGTTTNNIIYTARFWIPAHSGIYPAYIQDNLSTSANEWSSFHVFVRPFPPPPPLSGAIRSSLGFSIADSQFMATIGTSMSTAAGCWITKTDLRAIRVIQLCASIIMFHKPSSAMASGDEEWNTIRERYDTFEHALVNSEMGTNPHQISLLQDSSFIKNLSECELNIGGCAGLLATKLFSLITLHNGLDNKQSMLGIFFDKIKANLIPVTILSANDSAKFISTTMSIRDAFFAKDYDGSDSTVRSSVGPSIYVALHPGDTEFNLATRTAFIPNAMETISSSFVESSRQHLIGQFAMNGVTTGGPSPGWVREDSTTLVSWETRLEQALNSISYMFNSESLVGSIIGCFDSIISGLRFCIAAQFFHRQYSAAVAADYTPSRTPQEAMRNAPPTTVKNALLAPINTQVADGYYQLIIDPQKIFDAYESWTQFPGFDGSKFYIDAINIVGMKFGPYLNQTHFAPGHAVSSNGFYIYRTEAPREEETGSTSSSSSDSSE